MNLLHRWWCSKGHGIHSPFAYRMVTEVLPERARYYAYEDIGQMPDASRLKLLFRLVCEFVPSTVYAPSLTDDERRVILMADSRVRFVDEPVKADFIAGALPLEMRSGQTAVTWRVGRVWRDYKRALRSGMTFSNGRYGIVVNRPGLPRQDFESLF